MTPAELSVALFVQMAVIVAACRAVGLLAPMFFTFSGLNTQMNLVDGWSLAAARLTGQDNATGLGIGALMNADEDEGDFAPAPAPAR